MTLSDKRFITDEQLSAYLDNAVTAHERQSIEAAVAQDTDVAWRLESLRHTVTLLQALPEVPLPRSFALTLDHLQQDAAQTAAPSVVHAPQPAPVVAPRSSRPTESTPGLWERFLSGWQGFWGAGNLTLRNAAAVSLALLVVLLAGTSLTDVGGTRIGTLATAPMSAPASQSAPDVIALAEPAQGEVAVLEDSVPTAPKLPIEETAPADAATESTAASPAPEAAALAMVEEEPAAPAEESAPGPAAAMLAPEIGAAPPVNPMVDPASPGVLMPPGGMGMGGGMGGGGDMQGGAGGSSERLLPPEVYSASPDDVLVIEPTPLPPAPAAAAEAPAPEAAPSGDEDKDTTVDDEPTPAAVALVQPQPTEPAATARSAATEMTETATQPVVSVQSYGLPLLGIAQAGGALLTLVLASLWWRSRRSTPRE